MNQDLYNELTPSLYSLNSIKVNSAIFYSDMLFDGGRDLDTEWLLNKNLSNYFFIVYSENVMTKSFLFGKDMSYFETIMKLIEDNLKPKEAPKEVLKEVPKDVPKEEEV